MLPPLLVLYPICLCLPDVCGLGGLIATTEQEDHLCAALDIVHAVARTVVNPEFPDTTTDRVRIPRIPKTHTGKTSTDTGTGSGIT
jgi:hypothetical protein